MPTAVRSSWIRIRGGQSSGERERSIRGDLDPMVEAGATSIYGDRPGLHGARLRRRRRSAPRQRSVLDRDLQRTDGAGPRESDPGHAARGAPSAPRSRPGCVQPPGDAGLVDEGHRTGRRRAHLEDREPGPRRSRRGPDLLVPRLRHRRAARPSRGRPGRLPSLGSRDDHAADRSRDRLRRIDEARELLRAARRQGVARTRRTTSSRS